MMTMTAADEAEERADQRLYPLAGFAQAISDEAAELFGALIGGVEGDLPARVRGDVGDVLRGALAAVRGCAAQIGRASPEAEGAAR
jgi:hypothetical protein